MSPETRTRILLVKRPVGVPDSSSFSIVTDTVSTSSLAPDQVLCRVLYVSIDPAMRGWMRDVKSYIPPVAINDVMRAGGIGVVVASRHADFRVDDVVSGMMNWQTLCVCAGRTLTKLPAQMLTTDSATSSLSATTVPVTAFLSVLGMTALTAYFGLLDVGRVRRGDVVLVSGAAGAVGSIVGQIAKLKGASRVIGTAGSDAKCAWLVSELGFDVAINYKRHTTPSSLQNAVYEACGTDKRARRHGIDVYFDNVGGTMLDVALGRIARGGRVVVCGAISQYNSDTTIQGPSNYLTLLTQRARMEGFVVFDYAKQYPAAVAQLARWVRDGRLQYREHIVEGLASAPSALNSLFIGANQGKLIVRVASPEVCARVRVVMNDDEKARHAHDSPSPRSPSLASSL